MSKAKHTPGPWKFIKGRLNGIPGYPLCCWVIRKEDARLISAAPDLLNGCKAALGLIQLISSRKDLPDDLKNLMDSHRVKEAQAAIEKAEKEGK